MIKFKNVTKTYPGKVKAVDNVSLHIKPKEFVSIVGQSGTGKTTLVRILIAEERPDNGQVVVGGWDITDIRGGEVPFLRRQIGVVFQDFKLLPQKTAYENIAFALEVCGASGKRVSSIVPQVLKIVGLKGKEHRYSWQLSGGEAQRVAIARALVHRPKILIADEPTGNLDAITSREIADLLLKINEFGTTVLLVTHDKELVNYVKKRVLTMEDGQVVGDQKSGKYVL